MCECWYIYDEKLKMWHCCICNNLVTPKSASDHNKNKYETRLKELYNQFKSLEINSDKLKKVKQNIIECGHLLN